MKHFSCLWTSPVLALTILLAGCAFINPTDQRDETLAYLEGIVTFSPLSPAFQEGAPTQTAPPELFENRFVLFFDETGKTELARAAVDSSGFYRAGLESGVYLIRFSLRGIERADNLPAVITIGPGQVIILDISVDTGIR